MEGLCEGGNEPPGSLNASRYFLLRESNKSQEAFFCASNLHNSNGHFWEPYLFKSASSCTFEHEHLVPWNMFQSTRYYRFLSFFYFKNMSRMYGIGAHPASWCTWGATISSEIRLRKPAITARGIVVLTTRYLHSGWMIVHDCFGMWTDGNDISVFTKFPYFRFDIAIYRYRNFDSIYRIIYRFSHKFIDFLWNYYNYQQQQNPH
ncbi:hypothetical protein ANN_05562 [Periplaneta americana]|uniref:Uncharacterized protein n=1 Tax=Periplaneta americana TaxID=6978 RepID=A0ABQ8TBB2_PERAM|nr:hypothetical protein ANN_05562 [Periplaneta americana]